MDAASQSAHSAASVAQPKPLTTVPISQASTGIGPSDSGPVSGAKSEPTSPDKSTGDARVSVAQSVHSHESTLHYHGSDDKSVSGASQSLPPSSSADSVRSTTSSKKSTDFHNNIRSPKCPKWATAAWANVKTMKTNDPAWVRFVDEIASVVNNNFDDNEYLVKTFKVQEHKYIHHHHIFIFPAKIHRFF